MTRLAKLLIVIVSLFSILLSSIILSSTNATTAATAETGEPPAGDTKPRPGIIMIVTFANGTTKAIKTDSTNIEAVNGGYFISDPSVKASQLLHSKTVSETVVHQLVSMFVDVQIEDPLISSSGCGEGYGYNANDPNPVCEPLDRISKGLPPDQAFCAALGCPYNPPADTETVIPQENNNNFATTPVTPTDEAAVGAQPEPQPEPGSDTGEGEQKSDESDEENQNGNSDSNNGGNGSGEGSSEGEGGD